MNARRIGDAQPSQFRNHAFGAALLAGVGAGVWPDLEAACGAAIEVARQIEPDAKTVERYSVGYQAYRKVYPALKGIQG